MHDTVDTLIECVAYFMRAQVEVELWKRDVSKAFRRLPISHQHHDLCWVAFLVHGIGYAAAHRGMPFGTISAVYAWHRVGGFLLAIVRRMFLAPGGRFVDDFFGCNRRGVKLTGGHCLSIIATLVGLPCDPLKDAHFVQEMTVLGALVSVDVPRYGVSVAVSQDKAERWCRQLDRMLADGTCDPGQASKFAGRFSFAVSVSCDRVGRAFVKPFYAQAHSPLVGHRISMRMRLAAEWWRSFLKLRMPPFVPCVKREHVLVWTDTAGESSWLAAVLCVQGKWFWTRYQVTQELWSLFIPRADDQIMMQELLAIPLAYETFKQWVAGQRIIFHRQ